MPSRPPINPTERLASSHRAASSPPLSPDGGPELAPAPIAPLEREPISLCQLGPCANLHVVRAKIDAQAPLDGSSAFHTAVIRTCYPAAGIEMDLSDGPVRECSRWSPMSAADRREIEGRVAAYQQTEDGRAESAAFQASWAGHPSTEGDD